MFDNDERDGLETWVQRLASLPSPESSEELVSRLRTLEEIACAVTAAQARDAAELDAVRRAERAAADIASRRRSGGVAAEVALARRVSPHAGSRLLGLAKVLTSEMPCTLALMTGGQLSEWRASLLARETACLDVADRRAIDAELCGGDNPPAASLGDRELVAAARRLAIQVDARSVAARAAKASADRCVTIRPAPDTMTWVSALLPVADGVAVYAALKLAADTAVTPSGSEPRGRGQVMADSLVERVTGRNPLERPVDLAVSVVLSDAALLDGDDTPGEVAEVGPVPAPWVRQLIAEASLDEQTKVFIRQLYRGPHGGLVAAASRSRLAPPGLARLIELRDQRCRTPWCDAPIRQIDHVRSWKRGGRTSEANLQGLCERCNYDKQAPGWHAEPVSGPDVGDGIGERHVSRLTTPSGHTYDSIAPPLPGADDVRPEDSIVERDLRRLLPAA
ncbi:MAG: DUF222 domain-containing protein [Actinomycetales bacterium]